VESVGEWDSAYLNLAAYDGEKISAFVEPVPLAEDTAPADMKREGDWQNERVAIAVLDKATRITLSLVLAGNGRARMRSLRIEQG
jgi:hypothetical protein